MLLCPETLQEGWPRTFTRTNGAKCFLQRRRLLHYQTAGFLTRTTTQCLVAAVPRTPTACAASSK